MKQILIIILSVKGFTSYGQTIQEIDKLRNNILQNLEKYECLEYFNQVIYNDDAMGYDTAHFYQDSNENIIYMKWQTRAHSFHITGDSYDITELFFMNNKVVFNRSYGYYFENPQWHLEPEINETKISMSESIRRYYKEDGTAIMDYERRETKGKYKDRFNLLDSIPLIEVRRLIWTDRCDACIEKDYLSIYRKLHEGEK